MLSFIAGAGCILMAIPPALIGAIARNTGQLHHKFTVKKKNKTIFFFSIASTKINWQKDLWNLLFISHWFPELRFKVHWNTAVIKYLLKYFTVLLKNWRRRQHPIVSSQFKQSFVCLDWRLTDYSPWNNGTKSESVPEDQINMVVPLVFQYLTPKWVAFIGKKKKLLLKAFFKKTFKWQYKKSAN